MLQLRLLDGVELILDGRVRVLGPPQRRGVLAVLAVRRGQWVSGAALVDALYEGARVPSSGTGVVQTHISALRRVLEPDRAPRATPTVLLSGHGGYQLRVTDEQVDVGVFDRLVAAAGDAGAAGDWGRAELLYAEALALYSGEPLAGIPGPWAEQQRMVLAERRLAVVEDSLEIAVRHGRAAQTIDTLRMLTAEHPLRERLRALLMRALADRGRRSEALAVYRDTRRLLVDELGVEPGAELRRVHERILEGWEPAPVSPADEPAPEWDSEPIRLLDRERELSDLDTWVRRAGSGRGGLILITGRSGYGKTCLLDEFARRYPRSVRIDLLPGDDLAAEMLRQLGGASEVEGDERADDHAMAARLRTAIAQRTAAPARGADATADAQGSADQPLLVLIDNAAEMDDRSAKVLAAITPGLRRSRALVVMTLDERSWDQRVLDLHASLEPLAVEILRPRRLSPAGIAELFRERTGVACPAELATRIQWAAGEIPMLVDALISDLADREDPTRIPDRMLDGRYSRAITRLLQWFSADGAVMMRALSVLQEFEPGIATLAAAADEAPGVTRQRCELLADAGILASADPPAVRHPLIANTIHRLSGREESARFCTAAAEHERRVGFPARRVARYLRELCGPRYARWTVVLVDAAEEALRDCVIVEAVRWLELALHICGPEERDDLLVRLGQLELWTNPAAARARLDEALRGQRARGVNPTAAVPLAWTMAMRREATAAIPLLHTVIAETEARDRRSADNVRASLWMVAALTAQTWNDLIADLSAGISRELDTRPPDGAGGELDTGMPDGAGSERDTGMPDGDGSELVSDPRARAARDDITAAMLTWADAFGVRIDARTALERLTPGAGAPALPRPLIGMQAHLAMWGGDLGTALRLTELRADQHFGAIDTYRAILRSEVMLRSGAYRDVLAELGPVLGDIDDALIVPPATVAAQYAHALLCLGRVAEAEQWLDRRTADANPETWEWTVALHIRALVCAERGDVRKALGHFLEVGRRVGAVGIANPAHIPWRSSAAIQLLCIGERARAHELVSEELALAHRWNTPATIGRAMRVLAAAAPGGPDAALLERAVALLHTQDSPVELIPALLDLARLHSRAGNPDRARPLLDEARTLAEPIGAARHLAEIDALLAGTS
ncbi:AAA family ATPase [Nocardia sp. 2]|uniref:AAA family ATPase n=1 Tax=Nocardia acididurans TaxID=2802282 RepID=A0ABS1MG76_9NOCA|nr:BTAD domain-containing putative transcriptional regulator [Nocardia acididurans]MBL1079266.1 AAA family ATPase [Nocardia acididurans]